jgi:GT2 family glycosyltransferase
VCIVNWNCRELLRACLESLCRQAQGVRVEVIVVDNGSSDGAAEMVAHDFSEVILERNGANLGFARACNQAAKWARGRYLFFLNNDTLVPPGAMHRLFSFAQAHPDIGILGPRLIDGLGGIQVSYRKRPSVPALLHRTNLFRWSGLLRVAYRRYRRQHGDSKAARPVEVLMGAAMLLRRQVFLACGGWDEGFTFGGEDIDLCTRIGRERPIVHLPSVAIVHYGRMSTRRHLEYTSRHIALGTVRYLRKHGCSRPALLLYKLAVTLDVPLLCLDKGLQYLWRRVRGRHAEAEKTWLVLRGLGHFVRRGFLPFWKA